MESQTGGAIAGAIFVLANVIIFWVREWLKNRTWRTNGRDLKEIKEDVKSNNEKLDKVDQKIGETKIKVAEIKTAVNAQARHCKQTVSRFDETMTNQGKEIIKLAWKKSDKT